jgi:hypothetical protein
MWKLVLVKKLDLAMDYRESFDSSVKRRLSLGYTNPMLEDEARNGRIPMITDGSQPLVDVFKEGAKVDQNKWSKKHAYVSPSHESTGSFEDLVRSQ